MSLSYPDVPSEISKPKAAVKGFSLSLKSNAKKPLSSTILGKRPRSAFTKHDAGGSEDEHINAAKHEVVTELGPDGATHHVGKKQPDILIIPKLENRDWKSEVRSRTAKNLPAPNTPAIRTSATKLKNGSDAKIDSDVEQVRWGLSVRTRGDIIELEGNIATAGVPEIVTDLPLTSKGMEELMEPQKPGAHETEDDLAIAALLEDRKIRSGPDLIIPATSNVPMALEEDPLTRDLRNAPEVSTLEDYERVPVEEFGAALLRGMGWKGEKNGRPKEVKRRQNLLGLGAKELKDAEELGAWVQKSDVKRLQNSTGRAAKGSKSGEKRPKISEYMREEERRRERRKEKHER